MAKHGSDEVAFFLIGGYDILGTLTELDVEEEAMIEETTPLGTSFVTFGFTGVRKAEITQKGFYDDTALGMNDALASGNPGQSRVLCVAFEGTATGKQFLGFSGAMEVKFGKSPQKGLFTKAAANYHGNGVFEQGKIVRFPNLSNASAITATGTPVDNGASNTSGGAGYVQVSNLGGFTNAGLTVRLLDSPDNITYGALLTHTSATAAPFAERKAIAGAIQRYVAYAASGTTGSANTSMNLMVGLVRN